MRAAIVMPAVFAFADRVIGNPNTTLFSAFGSFAVLVLADFGGAPRRRLAAYVWLAVLGAGLIALGTLCSQEEWIAVAGMAVIGFAILFARLLGSYFASGAFAALLLFIIPIGVPAPVSAVPDRLIGWFLATAVGIAATMLVWPTRHLDALRRSAAHASRALADLIDPARPADASDLSSRTDAASSAVNDLRRTFVGTPLRPNRPTGPSEAVAFLVDALEWVNYIASPADHSGRRSDPCGKENREVNAAAAAVLGASAENLEGHRGELPLDRLERSSDAVQDLLAHRLGDLRPESDALELMEATDPSFHTRELALITREVGINALRSVGAEQTVPGGSSARRTGQVLRAHLAPTSASFRNSVRGAIGLAAAVLVIETLTVQHGFWIVLATLSVLRSTALGTGSTVVQALVGTVAGIVAGGLLLYGIGSDEGVLWLVLPLAVLLAAYGSRALPLAFGQAGFTVTVLVIFNIIVPSGWQIGLVRVEDVAIGSAISLAVGILFWPRGMETLIRESLGVAYTGAAGYVASAIRLLAGGAETPADLATARREARSAADRLDDAFRQYLAEPSAESADRDKLASLVSGAARVQLAGYALSTLSPGAGQPFTRCGKELVSEAEELCFWYGDLATALARGMPVAAPSCRSDEGPVLRCVTKALPEIGETGPGSALSLLWAEHGLGELRTLGTRLSEPVTELARS